jgi:octaprenyl-diphosphate synthase
MRCKGRPAVSGLNDTSSVAPSVAWLESAMNDVRGRLSQRLSRLADLGLMPRNPRVAGKLLRPRLLLIFAAAGGKAMPGGDRAVSLAAAVELIHLATLHHDDVLDDSPHRRQAHSTQAMFGNKVSILFGDALVTGALEVVLRSASRPMQIAVIRAVTATLSGEVEQHLGHRGLDVAGGACVKVARLKTGSLFGLAARLGALLGGLDPAAALTARRLGRRLGTAFQLIDDALDYAGDLELLGKEPGADYRKGIATLPLVRAWQAASEPDRLTLKAGFGHSHGGDFATVREIVLRSAPFGRCMAAARRQLGRARVDRSLLELGPLGSLLDDYVGEIERRIPDPDHLRRLTGSPG